jgi:hypothetical protein
MYDGMPCKLWQGGQLHGPIPVGKVVNHLCRVKTCYEVTHLEVVTPRENTQYALVYQGVTRKIYACRVRNTESQRRRKARLMPRQKNTGAGTMTPPTNFDTSVRDGFREQIKTALHDAIDAGDYDLVGALTEFGKRVDNLRSPRGDSSGSMNQGGNNTQTSGINQGADVEPVVAGPADGETP